MADKVTRRDFFRKTGVAAVATAAMPLVVSARALGQAGKVAANDRLGLGFIGVGGMGSGHLGGFLGNPNCEVLAVCDVDQFHRDHAAQRVGEKCGSYNDHRELLDRSDIDAVIIATPDHWHALTSIDACEAGKDVYCEKPLTLTIEEGQKMVATVRRYARVFQTGSQQRSSGEFRQACELVRSGRIGKVKLVRVGIGGGPTCGWEPDSDPPPELDWNRWLGPAPWSPYNKLRCHFQFRWFYDYSGGMMTDWGHHHNDIAQWGLGTDLTGPVRFEGWGKFPTDGLFETATEYEVTYTHADGTPVICGTTQPHGITFEGPDGWVHVDRGFLETSPADLKNEKLGPGDVHLYESNDHHGNWIDCIRNRKKTICDVEIGHRSVSICHLCNIVIRTGHKVEWDPVAERITNDDSLNRWLSRPCRAPWAL
jgi:predicted dehydrogenase